MLHYNTMLRLLLATLLVLGPLPAWAETRLKAVATFSILADFVAEVGGDKVEVSAIVGPDTDVPN